MFSSEDSSDSIEDIFKSPSAQHLLQKTTAESSEDDRHRPFPFDIQWVYGLNASTPIINLNNKTRNQVFFAAAHNGILYDYDTKMMKFLQNHENVITNIARDGSGKVIVTADSGHNNCINFWNTETLEIIKKIPHPHENFKISKLSLSVDGKYLLTLGYESKPTVKVWKMLGEKGEPIAIEYLEIPKRDVFAIIFDPLCSNEFCLALERKMIFGYMIEEDKKNIFKTCTVRATFSEYGNFQCVTYSAKRLLACTDKGYLAIFKNSGTPTEEAPLRKDFLKIIKIERAAISVIKDCDGFIVICNDDGQIHIYNSDIKILFRFDNFDIGNKIKELSFNMTTKNYEDVEYEGIGLIDFINHKYYKIVDGLQCINAIAVHPERNLLCVGDSMGSLKLIDYYDKSVITSGNIPREKKYENNQIQITCLKFSLSGAFLVCGLSNGNLLLFDSTILQLISNEPLNFSKRGIKQIRFSLDSSFMALSNTGFVVFLCKYDCKESQWKYIGKHKAHCKSIVNMAFESSDPLKLLTFGEKIVNVFTIEYLDNGEISFVRTKTVTVEKYIPTKYIITDVWPEEKGLLVVSSDDYKYKVFDYVTERLLATYLGPRYSSPVLKMYKIPSDTGNPEYMVFCTEKSIGIQKLPLTGNPFEYSVANGHPIKVSIFTLTSDGKTIFTSGKGGTNFIQWSINTNSVEKRRTEGGEGITPYVSLIEGKFTGWIFQQLRVLFYYAQILCQGARTPYLRKISETIPVSTLPDIMRAIGYYPNDFEIKTMTNEVNFNIFNTTINNDVTFEDFVKLYVNYRPAFGECYNKYEKAFREFSVLQKDGTLKLNKSDLMTTLTTYGENMTEAMAQKILQILASQLFEKDQVDKFTEEELEAMIPKMISMEYFFGELLGFDWKDLTKK